MKTVLLKNTITIALFLYLTACSNTTNKPSSNSLKVIATKDAAWEKLNPARGDKSPLAATLWGDRGKNKGTGFLVKFVDGFSSPAHIHNVAYKGIVIEGLIHNDEPNAEKLWMPATSYWTQPAGESHITSARGKVNIAFIQTDSGPFKVLPKDKAFKSSETAFNIHSSNIAMPKTDDVKLIYIWKNKTNTSKSVMLKFKKQIKISVDDAKAVIIQGDIGLNEQILKPGSLIASEQPKDISFSCKSKTGCTIYVKSDKKVKVL